MVQLQSVCEYRSGEQSGPVLGYRQFASFLTFCLVRSERPESFQEGRIFLSDGKEWMFGPIPGLGEQKALIPGSELDPMIKEAAGLVKLC